MLVIPVNLGAEGKKKLLIDLFSSSMDGDDDEATDEREAGKSTNLKKLPELVAGDADEAAA